MRAGERLLFDCMFMERCDITPAHVMLRRKGGGKKRKEIEVDR